MSLENAVSIDDTDTEIFVPGRLCILGEHSDWAAEYRTANPSISFGKYLQFFAWLNKFPLLQIILNLHGSEFLSNTMREV